MNPTIGPSRPAALALALVALLLATVAAAGPASATAYRYWSYWQGASGEWVAAQTGPGDHQMVDEDVQGWRFAISTESVAQMPDNAPDFAALCPDLAAASPAEGQLRAAVVIDSGFVADAPSGQTPPADVVSCVTIPEGSTGNQALAAAAAVADQQGLICSINGYPADECSAEVSDADAVAAADAAALELPNPAVVAAAGSSAGTSTGSQSTAALLGGATVLALILLAAWGIPALRRRSRANAA